MWHFALIDEDATILPGYTCLTRAACWGHFLFRTVIDAATPLGIRFIILNAFRMTVAAWYGHQLRKPKGMARGDYSKHKRSE